jgi:hypothetical protein
VGKESWTCMRLSRLPRAYEDPVGADWFAAELSAAGIGEFRLSAYHVPDADGRRAQPPRSPSSAAIIELQRLRITPLKYRRAAGKFERAE